MLAPNQRTPLERTETADDLVRDQSLEVLAIPFEAEIPGTAGRKELCLFQTIVDVLEAWSGWRGGKAPSTEQAARAIVWYLENDAFIPIDH